MLRSTTITCLLAALCSAYTVLAEAVPQYAPHFQLEDSRPNLDPRQIAAGGGLGAGATTQAVQAPAVTVYNIATQVGRTAVETELTYTQLFVATPDPWPAAKSGAIGYGTLQRRDLTTAADAEQTVVSTVTQQIVIAMPTVFVTQPLREVTDVMIVKTMAMFVGNGTAFNGTAANATVAKGSLVHGTALAGTGRRPASLGALTGYAGPTATAS